MAVVERPSALLLDTDLADLQIKKQVLSGGDRAFPVVPSVNHISHGKAPADLWVASLQAVAKPGRLRPKHML
ncbi:hypothetical protein ABBQ38_008619 [Trebouxia sp. C0009 RCD-2024]